MIAQKTDIDVSLLPYNTELLNYLRSQKDKRKLVLASASNVKFVSQIAGCPGWDCAFYHNY